MAKSPCTRGSRAGIYRDGERYTVEPLLMLIDYNDYYLLCHDRETIGGNRVYRVDRMDSVHAETELIGEEAAAYNTISKDYTKQVFQMFSGSLEKVTLEFNNVNTILNHIFDQFGEDIIIQTVDEHTCRVTVDVQISRTFWAWLTIFSGNGDIRLIGPESVKTSYRDWLVKALESCEDV